MGAGPRLFVDGHEFRTEREVQLYLGLSRLARDGRLTRLMVHGEYPLVVNEVEIGTYTPTFQFLDEHGVPRTIAVRGNSPSPATLLKEKLFEALYDTRVERWG